MLFMNAHTYVKKYIAGASILFTIFSFILPSYSYAAVSRVVPTLPPVIQIPTHPPIPTLPKVEIKKGQRAVEIVSPEDKSPANITQKLPIKIHFNAAKFTASVGGVTKNNAYIERITAVELLLDGKSYEIKQLKPFQKEGDVIFDVSFASLVQDASQVQLQARIYTLYIPPKPPYFNPINKSAAQSDPITVLFKQMIGPEGGVAYGPNGVGDVSVIIPQGALQKSTPVNIFIDNAAWETAVPPPDEGNMLGIVNLDIGGVETSVPMDIDIPAPEGLTDSDQVLVVEIINHNGAVKYQLVDIVLLINDRLVSQLMPPEFSFPQIFKGGIFGFFVPKKNVEQKAEVGFVKGVVKKPDGQPLNEGIVTISNLPLFVSKTNTKGEYLVPSIVGSFSVTAFDPNTGNFKTVSSAVPNKGGGVILDIQLTSESLDLNNTLTNGGFESDINNWTAEGQVLIMSSLGFLTPQEGGKMVLLTTGALSVNHTFSTLKQRFILPEGAQKLSFKYDFVSREYPDYIGSQFNDQFEANLLTKNGVVPIDSMEVNNPKANFQPINLSFPDEDSNNGKMGHTGWRPAEVNVSQLDGQMVLAFTVSDVGDTIFDTGVLVDDVKITTSDGGIKFLSSPLPGKAITNLPINSIFDHNNISNDTSIPYKPNGVVAAYTGEKGEITPKDGGKCLENVNKTNFVINNHYKAAGNPLNQLCYDGHDGTDFEAKENIIAAADGVASFDWDKDSFHTIDIKVDGKDYKLRYLHLNTNAFGKNKGAVPVTRGQIIGTAGGWGKCYNPTTKKYFACSNAFPVHLHFTVLNPQRQRVDPYGWKATYPDPMSPIVKNVSLWLE